MGPERVVAGLSFPTNVAVGGDGDLYLAESGLPLGGAVAAPPYGGAAGQAPPEPLALPLNLLRTLARRRR